MNSRHCLTACVALLSVALNLSADQGVRSSPHLKGQSPTVTSGPAFTLASAADAAEAATPALREHVAGFYRSAEFRAFPVTPANSSDCKRLLLAVLTTAAPADPSRPFPDMPRRFRAVFGAIMNGPLTPEDRREVLLALPPKVALAGNGGWMHCAFAPRSGDGRVIGFSAAQRAVLQGQVGSPTTWEVANWTALQMLADDGDTWVVQWVDAALPLIDAATAADPTGSTDLRGTRSGFHSIAINARDRATWALDAQSCWRRVLDMIETRPYRTPDSFLWLVGRAKELGKPVEVMREELVLALEKLVKPKNEKGASSVSRRDLILSRQWKALAIELGVLQPTDAPSIVLSGLELVPDGCE